MRKTNSVQVSENKQMLITTYSGILINSRHIAFVGLRRNDAEKSAKLASPTEPTYRVVLYLSGGDAIVACDGLTRADADFLRRDIGCLWSEGCPSADVATSLARRKEGAYYAEETGTATA